MTAVVDLVIQRLRQARSLLTVSVIELASEKSPEATRLADLALQLILVMDQADRDAASADEEVKP